MPKRWTQKQKFWVYQFLVARDDEQCILCRRGPTTKRRLEIDHIDGNKHNEEPVNLCLLCSSCNKKLENIPPEQKRRILKKRCDYIVCVREREKSREATLTTRYQVSYQKGSPEMQANDFFEVDYREWVLKQVREHGFYPKNEAINAGAEIVGCSAVTSRRYLEKLTSAEGILEEYKNPLHQSMLRYKKSRKPPVEVRIDDLLKQALTVKIKKPQWPGD
jgi:hypothetical protein